MLDNGRLLLFLFFGWYYFLFKNSLVRKSGKELEEHLIKSILKFKTLKIACHLEKICLEARFLTSFYKISFVDLQSIQIVKVWFNKSLWNLEIHKTIAKICFLIVKWFCWVGFQCLKVEVTIFSLLSFTYLRMPPYPILEAFVYIIFGVKGSKICKHGRHLTWLLTCLTILVWTFIHGERFFFGNSCNDWIILDDWGKKFET